MKIKAETLFKLNSNKKVININHDLVFPRVTHEESIQGIRSVAFTPKELIKLEKLRAKYKISRSAIIRILLDAVEV